MRNVHACYRRRDRIHEPLCAYPDSLSVSGRFTRLITVKSRQAEPEKWEDLESEVSSSLVDGRELLIEESIPAARSLANGSKRDLS